MASPPKPWERGGTIAATAEASTPPAPAAITSSPASGPALPTSTSPSASAGSTSSPNSKHYCTAPPSVPARPASFTSPTSTTAPFGSPFTTPYNCFGTGADPHGSSLYNAMGSLGGYGGYGYGGCGMNGMYSGAYGGMGLGPVGMYGQSGMAHDPANLSVTQALESTMAMTFALLSVVQTLPVSRRCSSRRSWPPTRPSSPLSASSTNSPSYATRSEASSASSVSSAGSRNSSPVGAPVVPAQASCTTSFAGSSTDTPYMAPPCARPNNNPAERDQKPLVFPFVEVDYPRHDGGDVTTPMHRTQSLHRLPLAISFGLRQGEQRPGYLYAKMSMSKWQNRREALRHVLPFRVRLRGPA